MGRVKGDVLLLRTWETSPAVEILSVSHTEQRPTHRSVTPPSSPVPPAEWEYKAGWGAGRFSAF